MPRLGGQEEANQRLHAAYANQGALFRPTPTVLLCVLAGLFIVRNVLFHDYRQDVIAELTLRGKTPDEIAQVVPKTLDERQQEAHDQIKTIKSMKDDIAFLLTEVKALRQMVEQKSDGGKSAPER